MSAAAYVYANIHLAAGTVVKGRAEAYGGGKLHHGRVVLTASGREWPSTEHGEPTDLAAIHLQAEHVPSMVGALLTAARDLMRAADMTVEQWDAASDTLQSMQALVMAARARRVQADHEAALALAEVADAEAVTE